MHCTFATIYVHTTQLTWRDTKFSNVLGKSMFGAAVLSLVTEPKWMVTATI
jgi:hypothetical protein